MDHIDVEAFTTIIHSGSFSKAAYEMSITQPALSHRINMLEEELGYPLFVRGKGQRSIQLTSQGEALFTIAEQMSALHQQALDIRNMKQRTLLSVAATESVNFILNEAYDQFAIDNPDIYLYIYTYMSHEAYRNILNDQLDLAFINTPDYSKKITPHPFFEEPCSFICSLDSTYPPEVDAATDLDSSKMIWCRFNADKLEWYNQWFGKHGYPFLSVRNPSSCLPYIAGHPDRWSICPSSMAVKFERDGLAATRVLHNAPSARSCFYLVNQKAPKQEANRLLAFLAEYLAKNYPCLSMTDILPN